MFKALLPTVGDHTITASDLTAPGVMSGTSTLLKVTEPVSATVFSFN